MLRISSRKKTKQFVYPRDKSFQGYFPVWQRGWYDVGEILPGESFTPLRGSTPTIMGKKFKLVIELPYLDMLQISQNATTFKWDILLGNQRLPWKRPPQQRKQTKYKASRKKSYSLQFLYQRLQISFIWFRRNSLTNVQKAFFEFFVQNIFRGVQS